MSRGARRDVDRELRAKRAFALERNEIKGPSEPRAHAPGMGPTAMASKVVAPDVRKMIDEAVNRALKPCFR